MKGTEVRERTFLAAGLVIATLAITGLGALSARPSAAAPSALPAVTATAPPTSITVNGDALDGKVYQGIGAVLGGGGNARYLEDYPAAQRNQIINYLFEPGYGASLQILKLEIGGGTNSTDGAEASIEPQQGQINCNAGYEFAIAQQALQANPNLILYGLQWTAPSWVSNGGAGTTLFTPQDINYLLDWLHCATGGPCAPTIQSQHQNCPPTPWHLPISYLGGWNENATGSSLQWYSDLQTALATDADSSGQYPYANIKLIAGDLNQPSPDNSKDPDSAMDRDWQFAGESGSSVISVLGEHDICGQPTEELQSDGTQPTCEPPEVIDSTYVEKVQSVSQPLWASELGHMDAGAQPGCAEPCAPAMDEALVRGYHEAGLTGYLEWPALDAMPQTGNIEDDTPLNYENRGLITADQPWSGNYTVNAMTWAIAQFTDFVTPPDSNGHWLYENHSYGGTGYLADSSQNGAYVTFIHENNDQAGDGWTTVIDTTSSPASSASPSGLTAPTSQTVNLSISGTGGSSPSGLCALPVYEWSSEFDLTSGDQPANWFQQVATWDPKGQGCSISFTAYPGYVYTFTTRMPGDSVTPGGVTPGPDPAVTPASSNLSLPYSDLLDSPGPQATDGCQSASGQAVDCDDEPQYLDAQDGSFEIVPCTSQPPGGESNCTGQTTVRDAAGDPPVLWHPAEAGVRFPYAIIGDGSWSNYTESVDMLLPQSSDGSPTSGGLIGYYTLRAKVKNAGLFDGYVFDLSTTGTWQLVENSTTAGDKVVLASGTLPSGASATGWNNLSLSFANGPNCGSPEPTGFDKLTITVSIDGTQFPPDTTCAVLGTLYGLGGIEAGYTTSTTDNWPAVQYSDLSVTSP